LNHQLARSEEVDVVKGENLHLLIVFFVVSSYYSMVALHQGAPGQMTWLEDPPPWLPSWLRPAYCFALLVWTENKNFTISGRWLLYLFYFDRETISAALAAFVFW